MKLQLIAPISSLLIGFSIVPGLLVGAREYGGLDENGCGGSVPDWCPETQECIAGWMDTCPIEDGQTFVGGTELTCVDGRCNTDEICLYEDGTSQVGFFYTTRINGPYEVPGGCTLTCTGCEPVADDSANQRPLRIRGRGRPSPAAVNCINKGGTFEPLTAADGGQYSVCRFSDGSACDTWALFRGECAKGDKPFFSSYCADSGGEMSNEDVIFMSYGNAPAIYEVCTVNGAQCAAEDYYNKGCVFGTIYCATTTNRLIGRPDENGCAGGTSWCPETQKCIRGWMETCPIEDGQTFVGGTELRCLDGRCNTDERCTYESGTARFAFFYIAGVNGHNEVPSGCTLTCTGCEPATAAAVADDAANRPAAINCINAGGAVETLTQADGGQYGVCLFPDGSACDALALLRGECAKGDKPFFSAYCGDSGGEMSNEDVISWPYDNVLATYDVCTVNGARCAAEDYYSTGCVFGTIYCANY